MAEDPLSNLTDQHNDRSEKYAYYLATVSASAVALTVTQLQGARLAWPLPILIGSVGCWTGAFWAGIAHIARRDRTSWAQLQNLKLTSGRHDWKLDTRQEFQSAVAVTREAMERNAAAAVKLATYQRRLVVWGGVLYGIWVLVEKFV